MDARGAAVYNLSALRQQIRGADPTQEHFAAIESYLAHDRQDKQLRDTLQEIYGNGGVMKVLFGVFGKGTPFELRPSPDPATLVIADWLKAGLPPGN